MHKSDDARMYDECDCGERKRNVSTRCRACYSKDRTEAFWSKVRRHPTECWEWLGNHHPNGYGQFASKPAYRFAAKECLDDFDAALHVCHRCDNRLCVRPSHLFMGTHLDNMRDRDNKGRTLRGGANGNSRLSESDVLVIRKMLSSGTTQPELARKFNVTQATISGIYRNKTWRHI